MIVAWQSFEQLSAADLYRALRLRQMVFVVEQNCSYLDADGLDQISVHGLGRNESGEVVAVARIVPPGRKFPLPSIGRIAVARQARGRGQGRLLVTETITETERRYPHSAIQISAQAHLERFYRSFGFVPTGDPFDEDGIPHIAMIRDGSRRS